MVRPGTPQQTPGNSTAWASQCDNPNWDPPNGHTNPYRQSDACCTSVLSVPDSIWSGAGQGYPLDDRRGEVTFLLADLSVWICVIAQYIYIHTYKYKYIYMYLSKEVGKQSSELWMMFIQVTLHHITIHHTTIHLTKGGEVATIHHRTTHHITKGNEGWWLREVMTKGADEGWWRRMVTKGSGD